MHAPTADAQFALPGSCTCGIWPPGPWSHLISRVRCPPQVGLVGLPNVGKSTFFNILCSMAVQRPSRFHISQLSGPCALLQVRCSLEVAGLGSGPPRSSEEEKEEFLVPGSWSGF